MMTQRINTSELILPRMLYAIRVSRVETSVAMIRKFVELHVARIYRDRAF